LKAYDNFNSSDYACCFFIFQREGKTEAGGVILIGPLPIIFGSNKKFLLIAVIGALVLAISVIGAFLI